MKKYTKQDVLDQRISFKPMTKEQHHKLCKHFGVNAYNYSDKYYFRFYESGDSKHGLSESSYLNAHCDVKSNKEISFEEFDFEEPIVVINFGDILNTISIEGYLEKLTSTQNYAEGDTVRIKSDLNVSRLRNVWPYFTKDMDMCLGITGVIVHVRDKHVRVKFSNGHSLAFLKEWIEPVFKVGDWAKIGNGYVKIIEIIEPNIVYSLSGLVFRLEDCTLVTKLPEKWKVRVTRDNIEELAELRGCDIGGANWKYMTSNPIYDKPFGEMCTGNAEDFEEIPLGMLKDFESKKTFYKLKDPKFEQFAAKLVNTNTPWTATYAFEEGDDWYKIYKEAGVLDLWFEAIKK